MNSASYVDEQIKVIKNKGIPLTDACWELAELTLGWPYIFGDRGQECTPSRRQSVYNSHPDQKTLITKCQVLNDGKSGCSGCKWFPKGLRVRSYDCRGFTYWILLKIYGWELKGGGATSQWNTASNWKAKGTIDNLPVDTLVCLFYVKKDEPSKMAHTGLGYHGTTYECSNGVQYSATTNKKWTHWAIPACVDGSVPVPDPDTKPTLRRGSKGEYVKMVQEQLLSKGYDLGKWGADGSFGAQTEKAVKEFQQDHGLTPDGVVGAKTYAALEEKGTNLYTVTIPHLPKFKAEAFIKDYSGATMKEEGT